MKPGTVQSASADLGVPVFRISGPAKPFPLNSAPPSIPDHELLRVIGRGAYGEVWLAQHTRLGTLRAVKIVRRDQFGDARPFQREFDGIRRYEPISRGHRNLVAILHVGGTDECFYYVMELGDSAQQAVVSNQYSVISDPSPRVQHVSAGRSLNTDKLITDYSPQTLRSELKRHGALPIDRCIEIGHALASALAHLHTHSLVHRDVKPSNVIFADGVPKLADIGLVAGVDEARSFVGTEGYIPPEGPGAPSADCYSLGKLLYELSTGHDRTAWPEPPADLATRPDRERLLELNAVIHRACAPDARERYANAETMLADLELLRVGKSVKRRRNWEHRWVWAKKSAIAASIVGLVVIVLFATSRWRSKPLDPLTTGKNVGGYPPTTMRGTRDLEAWNHYKLGWSLANASDAKELVSAEHEFREAIRLDRKFVLAHWGLFFVKFGDTRDLTHAKSPDEFRDLAATMVELDDGLAETHVVRGLLRFWEWNWMDADREYREALRLNPDCQPARTYYGWYLVHMGRAQESLEVLESARRVDPTSAQIIKGMGHSYFVDRDFTNALAYYRESCRIDSKFSTGGFFTFRALIALDQYPAAIDELEICEAKQGIDLAQTKQKCNALKDAFVRSGREGFWRKRLEQAIAAMNPEDEPYAFATVYARLGEKMEAFENLERAYARHDELAYLIFDECWDSWREEPRFKALMAKVGLAEIEREWLLRWRAAPQQSN